MYFCTMLIINVCEKVQTPKGTGFRRLHSNKYPTFPKKYQCCNKAKNVKGGNYKIPNNQY